MKHQTLITGSVVAAGLIAAIICVGMVSGFSAGKPFISVDPLSDRNAGDLVAVTGKTSLPAGTTLLIEAYPASYQDQTGTGSGVFSGTTGTITVSRGSGSVNTWSWSLDTSTFKPMEYLISVSSVTGDLSKGEVVRGDTSASTTFTLKAATSAGTSGSSAATGAQGIGIVTDPIPETIAGNPLTVTGKTSLPVGTVFSVKVVPASKDTAALARNYQNPASATTVTVVKGDGTTNRFSVTLDTRTLSPDEYILVVSPQDAKGSGTDDGWTGTALFNILPRSSANDSAQGIGIVTDPIPETIAGNPLTVTGKTSLPVGTVFSVKVVPASKDTATFVRNYQNPASATTVTVVKGDGTANRFSVTLDTRTLSPDEYILVVSPQNAKGSGTDDGWTGTALFNILPRTAGST